MNELQTRLIELMAMADHFNGIHKMAGNLGIFSWNYLHRVRNESDPRNIKDSKDNRKKVKRLIKFYENEITIRRMKVLID